VSEIGNDSPLKGEIDMPTKKQGQKTPLPPAKILFKGLMLMCINKNKQCEVGFVQCPGHEPRMDVKISRPGQNPTCIGYAISNDLYLCAVGSRATTVKPDTRTSHSIGKRPDLESNLFHKEKVTINTSVLSTRIRVNVGRLQTHSSSDREYDVVEWVKETDPGRYPKKFGKLATVNCIEIEWGQNAAYPGIAIFDRVTHQKSWLPAAPDTTYEITIDSACFPPVSKGTDFRLYYSSGLITAKDSKKFDFEPAKKARRSPDICEVGFLSKTSTLGLPFATFDELNDLAKEASKQRDSLKNRV
jgi:hypothetical protein